MMRGSQGEGVKGERDDGFDGIAPALVRTSFEDEDDDKHERESSIL
jgi:hypothetical protein